MNSNLAQWVVAGLAELLRTQWGSDTKGAAGDGVAGWARAAVQVRRCYWRHDDDVQVQDHGHHPSADRAGLTVD